MAAGEPAFLSEEYANDLDPDLELVTTSVYGKNGAISVLQVRKEKLSSFSLWFWWIEIQSLLTISKSEMFKFNFKRIIHNKCTEWKFVLWFIQSPNTTRSNLTVPNNKGRGKKYMNYVKQVGKTHFWTIRCTVINDLTPSTARETSRTHRHPPTNTDHTNVKSILLSE